MVCECAQNWRLELVFWGTGETLAVIIPESFEFQSLYQEHGNASVRFKMSGVSPPQSQVRTAGWFRSNVLSTLFDSYPGDCGIVIQRVAGPGATWEVPHVMFAGTIETLTASANGDIAAGLVEVTEYLERRVIRNTAVFTAIDQTSIAASLVNYSLYGNFSDPPGGPAIDTEWNASENLRIEGVAAGGTGINRDRTYEASERPTIWELLKNLMQISNGPEYRLNVVRDSNGNWTTFMNFYDQGEAPETAITVHWAEVEDAQLVLERRERTTLVEVFGRNDNLVTRTLDDADPDLAFLRTRHVRHDATQTYDVRGTSALEDWGDGFILDHYDPATFLRLTFAGLEYSESLNIDHLIPGNRLDVRIDEDQIPWEFVAGPSIPASLSPAVAADDLRFGTISVSVPNSGPEQVVAEVITSKTLLPIVYGEASP